MHRTGRRGAVLPKENNEIQKTTRDNQDYLRYGEKELPTTSARQRDKHAVNLQLSFILEWHRHLE